MNTATLASQLKRAWASYITKLDYTPLFVTVSGAHLYGFASPDSDIDLRGSHRLPLEQVIGLKPPKETYEIEEIENEVEVDLVSHDVGKYLRLMVKNNGYILEQIFSPLVIIGDEFLNELRQVASNCITRNHYFHYRGFFNTQLRLIEKSDPISVKSVLYAYRVLLTGIHLMETGRVEANLVHLNNTYQLPGIDELIASKVIEKAAFEFDWSEHRSRLESLQKDLDNSFQNSKLPEKPSREAVNQLLIATRLGQRR